MQDKGDTVEVVDSDVPAFRRLHPQEYYNRFLKQGVRPDGRGMLAWRELFVAKDVIETAVSSCMVRVGGTSIVLGVKAEIGVPVDVQPTHGKILVNVELPPLCSPDFKLGKPSELAQVTSQFLTQLLIDTQAVDLSTLCVKPGKAVWVLYVDIYCLNYDGNIIEPAIVALNVCLSKLNLPRVEVSGEGDLITNTEAEPTCIQMTTQLLPASFGVFDSAIVADPTHEEEGVMSFGVVVVCDQGGNLCCLHKLSQQPCPFSVLRSCVSLAKPRMQEIALCLESSGNTNHDENSVTQSWPDSMQM